MGQECIYLHEVVTNPLCPGCIEKQVKNWLSKKDKTVAERLPRFYEESDKGVTCASCGKTMDVCAYCYTEDIRFWLNQVKPEIEEEFLTQFSFMINI